MSAIVIITGPSCAGKSHLEALLIREPGFVRIVSHTTRLPRFGEIDGKEYFFVNQPHFNSLFANGEFAETVSFGGNSYGATRQQFIDILDRGENPVIVAEPNGRDAIIAFADAQELPVMPVFVSNPSDVIAERFLARFTSELACALATPGKADALLKNYSGRLDMMLGEEQEWAPGSHPHALAFGKYNAENQGLVLGRILAGAASLDA